jgi:DNA polymerase-1
MTTDVTLGVDGNWVLHRAFHTQGQRKDPGPAIRRVFVSMVCKDALLVKATRILVGFDGDNIFRYKIYRGYKGGRVREEGVASPYDYLADLLAYLEELGIPFVHNPKVEADDVMCSLASQTRGPVVVSTKDKDSFQFVRSHVRLLDGSAKPNPKITEYKHVEAKFGVRPELCVDLQTLIGDSIDDIPSILTKGEAIKGLTKWGSLREWLDNDASIRKKLRPHKDQMKINRKLVRLLPDLELPPTAVNWNKETTNVPDSYIGLRNFANPKSKGLFKR